MYINKNAYSTNILELRLNSNILSPYYLFEFVNDFNLAVTRFYCPDTAAAYTRYNEFVLCETGSTSVNLTAGTINMVPGGYSFNVYEASAVTLSVSGTTGRVVWKGKAFVNGVENLNEIYL